MLVENLNTLTGKLLFPVNYCTYTNESAIQFMSVKILPNSYFYANTYLEYSHHVLQLKEWILALRWTVAKELAQSLFLSCQNESRTANMFSDKVTRWMKTRS